MKQTVGLDMIVIDYLQLMAASAPGGKRYENRTQEVSAISRGLKAIAKELRVPVVALSQLSRAPETRGGKDSEPKLSDLRESGSIEQDADVVMFLYRPDYYNREDPDVQGKAKLIIAKQRNGPTDTIQLAFIKSSTRFETLDRSDWLKD
jgi:replicative DNA helicase